MCLTCSWSSRGSGESRKSMELGSFSSQRRQFVPHGSSLVSMQCVWSNHQLGNATSSQFHIPNNRWNIIESEARGLEQCCSSLSDWLPSECFGSVFLSLSLSNYVCVCVSKRPSSSFSFSSPSSLFSLALQCFSHSLQSLFYFSFRVPSAVNGIVVVVVRVVEVVVVVVAVVVRSRVVYFGLVGFRLVCKCVSEWVCDVHAFCAPSVCHWARKGRRSLLLCPA